MPYTDNNSIPTARIKSFARRALQEAGGHVLAESNRIVPFREGHLARSGRVTVRVRGDNITGTISYHTPYARRQHEETSWRHPHGRRAKFLETALARNRGEVLSIVANRMRRLFR